MTQESYILVEHAPPPEESTGELISDFREEIETIESIKKILH
jgi:hypothetical protein